MYGRIFVCRFKEFTAENSKTNKTLLRSTSLASAENEARKYFKKNRKRYECFDVEEITEERFPINKIIWIADDIDTESKLVANYENVSS